MVKIQPSDFKYPSLRGFGYSFASNSKNRDEATIPYFVVGAVSVGQSEPVATLLRTRKTIGIQLGATEAEEPKDDSGKMLVAQ